MKQPKLQSYFPPEIQVETPLLKKNVTLKVTLQRALLVQWLPERWIQNGYPMVTLKNTNSQHSIRPSHSTKEERVKTTTSFSRVDFFQWANTRLTGERHDWWNTRSSGKFVSTEAVGKPTFSSEPVVFFFFGNC